MTDTNILHDVDALLRQLFPICRSITGNGVRQSLDILRATAPFDVVEVPSGTPSFDWTVPDEWNVRDAYVADSHGRRLIDFQQNNLHLVSYSEPYEGTLTFDELHPRLYTLPDLPDAIPYRTSYYNRTWGFCLSQNQFDALDRNELYTVKVDTTLAPGSLTYGETFLPGKSGREFLITTYCCHPSLANDNLSGMVLLTLLLRELQARDLWHSYRFLIIPETIGALTWLAQNEEAARRVSGAYVITTVAGPGAIGFKRSFAGDHLIDRITRLTFAEAGLSVTEYPFDANGSDERQFSSPGFRIACNTICKDKYYEYPYYHTSLDNLDFAKADALVETLKLYFQAIDNLEFNRTYRSFNPKGEPMLGKRGLYPQLGGAIRQSAAGAAYGNELDAIRWLMFYSDGQTPLLDIAEKTGFPLRQLHEVAQKLVAGGLLELVG